ncbi:hypothetical protein BD310DRAFT_490357 [Dichomitus squalens]|uniref:Uncharacterized protein n=1 Tax=Dichomitus squalens TaxID=114155 RepID=A0A4Q9PUU0_9APHY|nr:hypothetical protein BD310DRAFT_490357 [Dichomitus squalens]
MARTSQAHKGTGATVHVQHQVGVWIQYRGPRARTLQTTRLKSARSNLTAGIVAEFFADLEALTLTIPGVTMVDVRIVWGTGQIRAQYGLNHGLHFYAAVKYLIKRAVSLFRDRMSERSIKRLTRRDR